MLFAALIIISVSLTGVMFATRERMLGFPCLIFWSLLGGYCYQQSTATWDMYYLTFFGSMGMAIFTAYAAFALKKSDLDAPKNDLLEAGKFIDEGGSKGAPGDGLGKESSRYIDEESVPSRRAQELHNRAADRRTGGRRRGPFRWGEFK